MNKKRRRRHPVPSDRRRRAQRARRRRIAKVALASSAAVLLLAGVAWAGSTAGHQASPALQRQVRCVHGIGLDRSGSVASPAVEEQWSQAIEPILEEVSHCGGELIVEAVTGGQVDPMLWSGSFAPSGVNDLERAAAAEEAQTAARDQIAAIMAGPAAGAVDLLAWFDATAAHLEGLPGDPTFTGWLFTDGLNSAPPLVMAGADLSPAGVQREIAALRSTMPSCAGWQLSFVGVNQTVDGRVNGDLAEGAERFWRAYVEACGGEIVRYDTALIGG